MLSQCIFSVKTPVGPPVEIIRHTFASQSPEPTKRVSLLAGLHGDELEGLYICHRLMQILKNLEEQDASAFKGEINIYPAVNPQALETGTRLWPFFSTDINRTFGKTNTGSLPDETSRTLLEDLKSNSDLVVDIHSSNLHLMELPQIRIIKNFEKKLLPLAKLCNVDLIWVHPHAEIFESTLGYNLNQAQIPTLVIETGICLRINKNHCAQIVLGLLNLLRQTGALDTDEPQVNIAEPRVVQPEGVTMIQAGDAGLFIKQAEVGQRVTEGEKMGDLIDPIAGQVLEEIRSPCSGLLFTLREHPLTAKGAPLARIATEESA
ncbi:MAG: succinylglutamate desuccinylase/aspartoacylase family protein [Nitrospinae bacterium]|nr:succinylglutamate desuccinylase/aspartoacylase family protein [Nitrospinota bacterium]MBL7021628.1 succinylglutamate desuccinylase/aspartoacylase family protein [Nitrospinaceae bacterium]